MLIHGEEEKMKNGYFHWISVAMRVGQVSGQSAWPVGLAIGAGQFARPVWFGCVCQPRREKYKKGKQRKDNVLLVNTFFKVKKG